jgi:hypothetical protein
VIAQSERRGGGAVARLTGVEQRFDADRIVAYTGSFAATAEETTTSFLDEFDPPQPNPTQVASIGARTAQVA